MANADESYPIGTAVQRHSTDKTVVSNISFFFLV